MQGKRVNDSLDTCFGTLIVSFGQLLDQVLKIYNFPLLWKPVMPQTHPRTITYSDQCQKTSNYFLRHFPCWIWRRTKMIRHKFQRVIVSFQVCFKVVTPEDIFKSTTHISILIWIYHQQNLNLGITGITKENWSLTFALKTDTAPHLKCEKHQEFTIFRNTVAQILKNIAWGTIKLFFSPSSSYQKGRYRNFYAAVQWSTGTLNFFDTQPDPIQFW